MAQLVERGFSKAKVLSSNLSGGTYVGALLNGLSGKHES